LLIQERIPDFSALRPRNIENGIIVIPFAIPSTSRYLTVVPVEKFGRIDDPSAGILRSMLGVIRVKLKIL